MIRLEGRMMRIVFIFHLFVCLLCGVAATALTGEQNLVSLDECIAIAIEKDAGIGQAEAVRQMREAELRSVQKDLLPNLSAGYTYQRQFDNDNAFFTPDDDYFAYTLTFEQPLYKGKSLVTSVKVGELQLQTSELSYDSQVSDLVLEVSTAYYDYLKNIKLQDVAAKAIERLQSHLKDAKAFYEAGLIPKNDLLESEVQFSQGQLDLLQAKNATELSRTSLNLLMRRPVTAELHVQDIADVQPTMLEWQSILDLALSTRPEIVNARTLVEISDKETTLARAPYLPSVSLAASYLKQGEDFLARNYDFQDSEVKQATANVRWRFWSWGQKNARIAASKAKQMQAEKQLASLIDSVTMQTREAYLNHERAVKNIEVTRTAVDFAEENYRINEARYQAQLNTSTQVLDAQTLLSRAKANYFSSLYDYATARARIDWVTYSSRAYR